MDPYPPTVPVFYGTDLRKDDVPAFLPVWWDMLYSSLEGNLLPLRADEPTDSVTTFQQGCSFDGWKARSVFQ